jgi:hypothetical protein
MEPQFMIIGHSVGVAAALAAKQLRDAGAVNVNTIDLAELHTLLIADGQKLSVSQAPPPKPSPTFDGSVCELGRCFQVDAAAAGQSSHHYDNATCGLPHAGCDPLGADEWLAEMAFWSAPNTTVGAVMHAVSDTVLKKSTVHSTLLPPSSLLAANKGFACRLLDPAEFGKYRLCSAPVV